jgi:hypothetical protein
MFYIQTIDDIQKEKKIKAYDRKFIYSNHQCGTPKIEKTN